MGVYIRGMEMPTRCGRCDMCITEMDGDIDCHKACCITGAIIENLGEKMDDCPLVPVPPHGRLGDLDALLKKCEFVCTDDDVDVRAVRYSVIDAAPTIIPADPAEEDET